MALENALPLSQYCTHHCQVLDCFEGRDANAIPFDQSEDSSRVRDEKVRRITVIGRRLVSSYTVMRSTPHQRLERTHSEGARLLQKAPHGRDAPAEALYEKI